MAVPDALTFLAGDWTGNSVLHMSWMPEGEQLSEGPSTLNVSNTAEFSNVTWDWMHEGDRKESHLLVAAASSGDEVSAGWSDTWHQSGGVLFLKGTGATGKHVSLLGSYEVPDHPNWGWRIEVEAGDDDSLLMTMTNISPEGEEDWAVKGVYDRKA